jgi:hypothetical protein
MTTAEALESIKDDGDFEILALRVLRNLYTDCRAVLHLGVNAHGRTIPNPVDGFCVVPGSSPRRYIWTAFTTNRLKDLEKKWLSSSSDSRSTSKDGGAKVGDLIKAATEAEPIRSRDSSARFVVYLCTNRRLSSGIIRSVNLRAEGLGIEAQFLDQSQIRDFLDVKPEGQWLRKEHLGIQADQISLSLLMALSHKSMTLYESDVFSQSRMEIVPTRAASDALNSLADPSRFPPSFSWPFGRG